MAHTFDTSAQIAAATTNPQAANYTCGSGTTLLMVTLIYANGTRTGAPTYNSVALTQADQVRKAATSPEACAEIWYLLDPPTGSAYSLSVPNPNGLSLEVCISSYKASANHKSCYDSATGNQNNSGANPSVTITTVGISVIVAVVASGNDAWAPSARSGTQLYDTDNGTWGGGHQYFLQSAAGAKAMSWTQDAEDWGICVAAFREVGIGINVSKADVYGVLTAPKGIGVSKANVNAVLSPQTGVAVSKTNAYAVLFPIPPGVNVSKAVVYAVIYPRRGGDFMPMLMRFMG